MFDPRLWEIASMVLFGIVIGAYMNFDLKFMTENRGDDYTPSDWSLAVCHFHTDIFYRFWKDLLS